MSDTLKLITQEDSWRREVQSDVVETIERMLDHAKAGELDGIAFAATTKDRCTVTSHSKCDNTAMLIGALVRLTHKLASE